MTLSSAELEKVRKQFRANCAALAAIKVKLEIIEQENMQLMKLISEVKEEPMTVFEIKMQKLIAKRNAMIKTV